MKYILLLALLTLYVAQTVQINCKGKPSNPKCSGSKNSGHQLWRDCPRSANDNMWYYSTTLRKCSRMNYKGCGGNSNRHCTLVDCNYLCDRSTG